MGKRLQGIVIGVLATVLLLSGVTSAASRTETINVTFRGIRIVVDGMEYSAKDSDGNSIEPFIYNGTTYLPVRAVSQALDRRVVWDGSTSTVFIDSSSPDDGTYVRYPNTMIVTVRGFSCRDEQRTMRSVISRRVSTVHNRNRNTNYIISQVSLPDYAVIVEFSYEDDFDVDGFIDTVFNYEPSLFFLDSSSNRILTRADTDWAELVPDENGFLRNIKIYLTTDGAHKLLEATSPVTRLIPDRLAVVGIDPFDVISVDGNVLIISGGRYSGVPETIASLVNLEWPLEVDVEFL